MGEIKDKSKRYLSAISKHMKRNRKGYLAAAGGLLVLSAVPEIRSRQLKKKASKDDVNSNKLTSRAKDWDRVNVWRQAFTQK